MDLLNKHCCVRWSYKFKLDINTNMCVRVNSIKRTLKIEWLKEPQIIYSRATYWRIYVLQFCSVFRVNAVLKEAQTVGMMTAYHNYLITNLVTFKIEHKDMTFDHDFGYSFPLFSSLLKKRGMKKRRMNMKNRDKKSCLFISLLIWLL